VVVEDEVVAVSVEFCAVALLKDSELEERLHVAALEAPVGAVTVQLSVTVPVNELPGVTVMVAVPVESWATVMLPLLERLKPVVVLVFGACQKSPQPATNGAAASNNHAHFPIFIAAPLGRLPVRHPQEPDYRLHLQSQPNIILDADQREFAYRSGNQSPPRFFAPSG
jgi:hypothetical protein